MYLIDRLTRLGPENKIIVKNALGAFIVKGLALLVSFFSTPAFITYFNDNKVLGVWYTLLSLLVWFLNFDLGIGNGIRNQLTKAFVRNDREEVRKILSSGIFSTGCVSICLLIIGSMLLNIADLNKLLGISQEIISKEVLFQSSFFIFCAIILRFFLTFVSSIFYSLQKSVINNFLALCVSVLQFVFILTFRYNNVEDALWNLSLAYLLFSNLPVVIAMFVVFNTTLKDCNPNYKYIDRNTIRSVMGIGGVFFICQLLYMLIMNTNEFLITKLFGSEYTAEYTFYYKITSLIAMIVTLALTPIWSVVTKAQEERNYTWLRKLLKTIEIGGLIVVVLQFLLLPFLQFIMDFWLGENVVEVNYMIGGAFACFGSVFVYSSMLSTIVCGMARMKLQLFSYLGGVILKFLFLWGVSKFTEDWSVVVWSNVLILLPYCVLQQLDLNRYIKQRV